MGSGGMIVLDEDTCMVEFSKYFLMFAAAESCGKCVPCRVGGQRLLEALTRITEGHGTRKDLQVVRDVSTNMMSASLCGLGQRTPGPVLAALRFFEEEFLTHVDDKLCRAGQCRALVRARCVNTCPAGVDTPAYLALVAQGRYAEGLAIHRRRNPFALVCGRACPAFCETKCRRAELDEPIAIRLVKRFMADHEFEKAWVPEPVGTPEERAAAAAAAGRRGRRRPRRLDRRAAAGPTRVPGDGVREVSGGGRDDDLGHPRLPPAAGTAAGRNRQHPPRRRGTPLQPGLGTRLHARGTARPARLPAPPCWPSARTAAAGWALPAKTSRA